MSRTKKKVLANITLEEAQEASQKFTDNATRLAEIEAKMNRAINNFKTKYQDEITQLKEGQVEPIAILTVYATEQRKTWGKRKSLELLHSIIGFRTGMPKVTKNKKFTWEGITEMVKELFPEYVRSVDELDKEAIIALSKDTEDEDFKEIKEKCFIDVVQDETFFVEVKKEEIAEAA